jgi:hypothetical protein
MVRWKFCRKLEHEWSATVNSRANGTGCPICWHLRKNNERPLGFI